MKIIFMGTPDFAVPVLQALADAGHEILLAVTQPDRARGRGKALMMPPVKEEALRRGIPVYQPERIRDPEALEELKKYPADAAVVVAFGQILPPSVLELPKFGCINVHASLLPLYRGAAPINHVILDGCEKTGVTTMQMDAGLDTGDMLLKAELTLTPDETAETLHDKLAALGARLAAETLAALEDGSLSPQPQEGESCYASMLTKEMGLLDWKLPAEVLERKIRGLKPWPGTYTKRDGKTLKVGRAAVVRQEVPANLIPGAVYAVEKDGFLVQTGEHLLKLLEVQPEGKKMMDAGAYLRGYPLQPGERLGE